MATLFGGQICIPAVNPMTKSAQVPTNHQAERDLVVGDDLGVGLGVPQTPTIRCCVSRSMFSSIGDRSNGDL